MAGTTTAAYTADLWTSPSTVDGSQNQWEYAVPVRQNSSVRRPKSRSSHDPAHARSRGSRSSSMSRHAYAHDTTYSNYRGRHDPSLSRHGSEAGSLRANYSSGNLRGSANASHDALGRGDMKDGIGPYMNGFEHENWIHRDKLAKIESEELQQAAIFFQRRGGLEHSRSQRGRNHDSNHTPRGGSTVTTPPTNESMEPWPTMQDDSRDITSSPTSFVQGTGEDRHNWDLRRPEEIAADTNAANFYQNPGGRKSSSRIPIPTSSPAPISPDQLGREFPRQRARGLTNGEDEALAYGKPRRASEPITVENLEGSTPPGASSRPGSRGFPSGQNTGRKTTGKGATATGTRKSSAPPATRKTTPRSRATSGNQRPTTRSGEGRAPHPVNRPEGDPPWLATMYKPDPRLPPEEQMLPTHARRIQQQMWEQEGRTPTMYDRQFAPLAVGPDGGPRPVEVKKEEPPKQPPSPVSPLPPPQPSPKPEIRAPEILPTPKSPDPSTRPSTGTGYSTMPKVQQEPPSAGLTPKWSPPVVTAQEPPKKEKGCGCCIVM
ncbi:uncharacterized protein KD926_007070 [Aspergillus affinis]|uniref:uncharacterized protein n=1 Tax=Aspergillus affinis TaxID=1070780 RepID=UPI0022FE24A4|nr:uncharacterized protein KD926_007070 [Aspergillus affinis]KAI9045767.1 hypothetical protein KD926_007070 [Aspergillus affinis]